MVAWLRRLVSGVPRRTAAHISLQITDMSGRVQCGSRIVRRIFNLYFNVFRCLPCTHTMASSVRAAKLSDSTLTSKTSVLLVFTRARVAQRRKGHDESREQRARSSTRSWSGEEAGESSPTSPRSPRTLVVSAEQLRVSENVKRHKKSTKTRQNPVVAHSWTRGNEKG